MKTTFVRIMAENMGDGWEDNNDAADGYAIWLRSRGIECEVVYKTGGEGYARWLKSQGIKSKVVYNTNDGEAFNGLWREWCESDEAKEYAMKIRPYRIGASGDDYWHETGAKTLLGAKRLASMMYKGRDAHCVMVGIAHDHISTSTVAIKYWNDARWSRAY